MIGVETQKNNSITLSKLIIWMLYLMPLVDTINGYLIRDNNTSGLGIIYRLIYLTIVLLCLLGIRPQKYDIFLICNFVLFIAIQFIVSGSYWRDSIELTVKLFTPLFMISQFEKLIHKKLINIDSVFKLMDWLSVAFSMTVLIPFALGIGHSTYGGGVGYKAFYYSTNEISFSICVIIMYLWYRMHKNVPFKYVVLYIFNVLCCLIIGSKVAAGSLVVFTFLLIWNNFIFAGRKLSVKRLLVVCFIIAGVVVLFNSFESQIDAIINRWITNKSVAETNMAFITSHRTVYLKKGFELFKTKGVNCYLFGWGLGGANNGMINIEMDFFDILFSCGILGFVDVVCNYAILIKKMKYSAKEPILILVVSLVLSFGGGHIMFTGLGGMMFAIMMLYTISINISQDGSSLRKDKQVYHKLSIKLKGDIYESTDNSGFLRS